MGKTDALLEREKYARVPNNMRRMNRSFVVHSFPSNGIRRTIQTSTCSEEMKFLAVHPSCLMYSKIYLRLEPLGLELVGAAAERDGHSVRLIDLQCESHRDFFRSIQRWRPDVIAFCGNYLANVPEIIDLARATRELLPDAFICVGGHSVSFIPRGNLAARRGRCRLRADGRRRNGDRRTARGSRAKSDAT